jgi:hypothetical protein
MKKQQEVKVGQAVRVALQSGRTVFAEVVAIDGRLYVVRERDGTEHRVMRAEIL